MNAVNATITFRHMEHSTVFREFAQKELMRLDKFLVHERTPITVAMVIEENAARTLFSVELNVQTPRCTLFTHDDGHDAYLVIKSVIDKMAEELRKEKEKLTDSAKTDKRQIK